MSDNEFEFYLLSIIREKKTGFVARLLKSCLYVLSWGYRWLVACRNWAFDKNFVTLSPHPGPVVISIGNIVAGGTGKTPFTLLLAQELTKRCCVAILSRGYRSPAEQLAFPIMLSTGTGPLFSGNYCGDEAHLLAKNIPQAIVVVGKNRSAASQVATKAGAQCILLDDGMQHRKHPRDIEIAIVNANDPYGLGYYLPRGLLRDSPRSLKRAHYVVINHVKDKAHFEQLQSELRTYTEAPMLGTRMQVQGIRTLHDQPIESIAHKHVGVFCGIGDPDSFMRTVQALGAHVVDHYILLDHVAVQEQQLVDFSIRCQSKGATLIICTEKDAVKLSKNLMTPLPVAWVKADLAIVEGQEHWSSLLATIHCKL